MEPFMVQFFQPMLDYSGTVCSANPPFRAMKTGEI